MTRPFSLRRTIAAFASSCAWALTIHAQAADPQSARNLVLQPSAAPVLQSQRLALVIGNSAYKDAPLLNPVNDARAMAKALQDAGFTVMLHTDVDHRNLLGAVRDFGSRLRQGGVGLFYFAGHGMQIKGRNYLIPVGADIQREDEVAYAALDAQAVLDKMETAGNGANLMLLDACRNNPFARSFRSSTQGLAQMEAPVGTLVAFATAPGTVASDGLGKNGLYTQHLLSAMRKPGAKVEDVFKQVRAAVRRDSQGKQIPWEATSLEGDLYFIDPPTALPVVAAAPVAAPAPAVIDTSALDDALWQALKGSQDAAVLRAYLERFPAGRHASQAQQRLVELPAAAAALATAPAQTVATAEPPVILHGSQWDVASVVEARQRVLQGEAAAAQLPVLLSGPGQGTLTASEDERATALLQAEAAQQPTRLSTMPHTALATSGALLPGDLWVFKTVDKLGGGTGDPTILQVSQVDTVGVPTFVGDSSDQPPITRFVRQLLSPTAHGFSAPEQIVWWGGMRRGDSRRVTLRGEHRRSDGSVVPVESSVQLQHRGNEHVRVPAGAFDALRLEADGVNEFVALSGRKVLQHWTVTVWYVPELRGFGATEADVREVGGSSPQFMRRNELMRFEPGAAALAAR